MKNRQLRVRVDIVQSSFPVRGYSMSIWENERNRITAELHNSGKIIKITPVQNIFLDSTEPYSLMAFVIFFCDVAALVTLARSDVLLSPMRPHSNY